MRVVDRKTWAASIAKHEAYIKEPVETYKRSVVEHFDEDDVYFASAEYVKPDGGGAVIVTYRVCDSHVVTP